jgi:hypothetical protein
MANTTAMGGIPDLTCRATTTVSFDLPHSPLPSPAKPNQVSWFCSWPRSGGGEKSTADLPRRSLALCSCPMGNDGRSPERRTQAWTLASPLPTLRSAWRTRGEAAPRGFSFGKHGQASKKPPPLSPPSLRGARREGERERGCCFFWWKLLPRESSRTVWEAQSGTDCSLSPSFLPSFLLLSLLSSPLLSLLLRE